MARRAQALLVVVGHPVLLLEANTWRNLILHCAARGAYKGAGASTLASRLGRGDSLAQGLENGVSPMLTPLPLLASS